MLKSFALFTATTLLAGSAAAQVISYGVVPVISGIPMLVTGLNSPVQTTPALNMPTLTQNELVSATALIPTVTKPVFANAFAPTAKIMAASVNVDSPLSAIRSDKNVDKSAALNELFEGAVQHAQKELAGLDDKNCSDVDSCIQQLKSSNEQERLEAVTNLYTFPSLRAVDAVIGTLKKDASGMVRRAAAEGLGYIWNPGFPGMEGIKRQQVGKIVEALIAALKDSDKETRGGAARALGDIGDSKALDALVETLQRDQDKWVRVSAAISLGSLQNSRAIPALVEAHRHETDSEVLVPILMALQRFPRDARAVDAIVLSLKDSNPFIWRRAALSIGEIKATGATVALPPHAIDSIVAILEGAKDGPTRQSAALALANIKDKSAVPALIVALDGNTDYFLVRAQAAAALGWIGQTLPTTDRAPIIKALKKRLAVEIGGQVRRAIQEALIALEKTSTGVRSKGR